ncbi:MAG: sulfotransferase [Candidatus Brocadia sp.]|nr:sulfotransferase [Candidatus Brocadia sp.]
MELPYRLIIICGLHRSGTTYLGKILSKNPNVQVINETSNPEFGVKGVPICYPYISLTNMDGSDLRGQLFKDIVTFKRAWSRKAGPKANVRRRFLLWIIGGRNGFHWMQIKMRSFLGTLPEFICLKDPFLTFSAGYFAKQYKAKVICMIRHPGAFYASVAKQIWHFDINNLLSQQDLINDYGQDIPEKYWNCAKTNNVASLAILWKVMARVINGASSKYDNVITLKHEDLCIIPILSTQKVCQHFTLDFTEDMNCFIKNTTQADTAEAPDGIVHWFRRNSSALVDSWRERLKPEDAHLLQEIIGDELYLFYEKW